ncbi:hypothetical protein Tco_1084547 [Tanacetum coccineum]
MNGSEVVHSVFNNRESDVDDSPVNDRFKTSEGFHAVPSPYTGNYMPPRPDLSFARLDESIFQSAVRKTTTSVPETETSIYKTSEDIIEKPKTVNPGAPIIEEWDTDSDNDSVFRPKSVQTKPKVTKINFVKFGKNVKSVNKENTHRRVEYPRKSQSPRGNRRNWNGVMTQKLGNDFEFIKKACFVCGSFNHLIKDYDFHENKMVEKPVLNNKGRVTGQREIRPVWNNAQRVNHQHKFTHPHPKRNFIPTTVVTKLGQVPVNAAKQSSPRAASSISTARPVNTATPKPKVNDALPVGNKSSSRVNTAKNRNSWVPVPVTTPPESGTSITTKMTVPATIEEKTCKKNDVKARSLLLMALPNEHQLTFDQYVDAQSMFAAIKARFGGNEATNKTQKALLKQQYENFKDLNVKFLRSLPSEWDTHVVVWMNKPDFDTMGLDDLYNNFKIVEQKVKKSAGASNDDKNLAFVNTAITKICTASFSDATIYAFLSTQPKGSQLVHEDLEQLHDDDLEEMDFKECRALGVKTQKLESSTATTKVNTASTEICTASFSDTTVYAFLSTQPKGSQLVHEDLEQLHDDDLLVKLSDTDFKAATYKRGLATLEGQIVKYKEHEVLFSEEIALLKRSVGCKEYELGLLRTELEKVKQEKEGVDFKIAKFDKSAKDLNEMLESQITDKSKKGIGYSVVPSPHPLILNRPTTLDLSYSGIEEFKEPEANEYGPRDSSLKPTTGYDKESDNSKENTDDSLKQHQMTDTETSSFESPLKVDKDWKEKFFYPANHVESVNQIVKPVERTVRYADKSLVEEQVSQVKSSFVEGCGSNTSKKVRKNNDAPIIEDWVSDDEEVDEHRGYPLSG